MNVWPFVPQVNVKETMQWSTEVIRCRAAEQRIAKRFAPRTTLDYSFQLLPQEIEAATVMARQWGSSEFLVPLWHELTTVGDVSSGAQFITVDTTMKRYEDGGYLFVMAENGSYAALEIDTVAAGQVNLVSPYVQQDYDGAIVAPCVLSRFSSPFTFRKVAGEYFTGSASFISAEDFSITGVNPYTVYNSSYVLTDRPLAANSGQDTNRREFTAFDNEAGPLYYSNDYAYPVSSSSITWMFNTDSEEYAFRLWLYIVKGKQGSFYAPRWTRDFIVTQDITNTDTTITVSTNPILADTYTGHVAVIENDGTQTYAEVTGFTPIGGGEYTMDLSGAIGTDILASDIEMITRMPVMRLNSDSIEFNYAAAGVVTVRLPIMETPT